MKAQASGSLSGLLLAVLALLAWSAVPLAQSVALTGLDSVTLTWLRFTVAVLVMGLWFALTRTLPPRAVAQPMAGWLLLAGVALALNYAFSAQSVIYLPPQAVAMLSTLLGPLFLLAAVVVLREPMLPLQWAGLALLAVGLGVFFGPRLALLFQPGARAASGALLILLATAAWIVYGLVQRRLGRRLGSQQTLWLIFCGAALATAPWAEPTVVLAMRVEAAWATALLCASTVVAYGAFSAAMNRIGAPRASAVTAVGPLLTLLGAPLLAGVPTTVFDAASIDWPQWMGAVVVVAGSAMCAFPGRRVIEP